MGGLEWNDKPSYIFRAVRNGSTRMQSIILNRGNPVVMGGKMFFTVSRPISYVITEDFLQTMEGRWAHSIRLSRKVNAECRSFADKSAAGLQCDRLPCRHRPPAHIRLAVCYALPYAVKVICLDIKS